MAIKVITIEDFSGGRNLVRDQILIDPSECASASENVWAPFGALTKTPGVQMVASASDGTVGSYKFCGWLHSDSAVNSGFELYARYCTWTGITNDLSNSDGEVTGRTFLFGHSSTDASEANATAFGYSTGTMTTNTTNVVTGSGTSWSTHVSAGDIFVKGGVVNPRRYVVSAVSSDTILSLRQNAEASSGSYEIWPAMKSEDQCAGISFNGSIWTVSTADIMQRYDGTGMTRIATAPKANFLASYKNYVFGFRTSTAQSRLYWSTIKDPTSWPANNFIDIEKDQGVGTGLFAFGNELLCFKSFGIFKVVGEIFDPSNPTYAVYPVSVPKGFRFNSNRSITDHRGRLYFIAGSQVYSYAPGASSIDLVSDAWNIDLNNNYSHVSWSGKLEQMQSGVSFNGYLLYRGIPRQISDGVYGFYGRGGIIDRRGKWWIADDSTENGVHGAYSIGHWAIQQGTTTRQPRLVGVTLMPNGFPHLVTYDVVGQPTVKSFVRGDAQNTTVAIAGAWYSKEFMVEYAHFQKLVIYLEKQTAGTLSVQYSIDQGSFTSTSIDMTTGRGNVIRRVIDINQRGSTIQFLISNTTDGQLFKVFALRCYYEPIEENRLV